MTGHELGGHQLRLRRRPTLLVIGANDVVNPLDDPCLARSTACRFLIRARGTVIVNKRSMAAGYAGLNELFCYGIHLHDGLWRCQRRR